MAGAATTENPANYLRCAPALPPRPLQAAEERVFMAVLDAFFVPFNDMTQLQGRCNTLDGERAEEAPQCFQTTPSPNMKPTPSLALDNIPFSCTQ